MIKATSNIPNNNSSTKSNSSPFVPQISVFNLASRRSAFSPYRPSTLLTNLQRGNIQTQTSSEPLERTIHQLAGLGELFLCNLDNKTVNEVDDKGLTPILWAAAYGQLAAVNTLHKHGADIHFKGPSGENALILAASNGHLQVIKLLLSWGMNINETDEDGNSALIFAVNGDHKSCVKELLKQGADITIENCYSETAYTVSVKKKLKAVQELLEKQMLSLLN